MSDSAKVESAQRVLRRLSQGEGSPVTGGAEASMAKTLSEERTELAHERLIRSIEAETGDKVSREARKELEDLILKDGAEGMKLLHQKGTDAQLSEKHQAAIEAIIEVDGSRPTLRLSAGDQIDLDDKTLGQWRHVTDKFLEQISSIASSVGRIDLNRTHMGTGFVVRDGLILTNRHVLQLLASETSPGKWEFQGEPTITFDAAPDEHKHRTRELKLRKAVVRAGSSFIDPWDLDYRKLDYAVLEVEDEDKPRLPAPLLLETDALKVAAGRPVFVVGYPAKPSYGLYTSDVLQKLFAYRYGVKRFSPGEIDRGLGTDDDGTGSTVFTHDSTTLGGNSGSCIVDFGNDGKLVVGLHFAGLAQAANYAHSNARLRPEFKDLQFDWREWI